MCQKLHKAWWRACRPLTLRIGRLPVGIWIAWLALAYAGGTFAYKLRALRNISAFPSCGSWFWESLATWAVLISAAIALARRRLVSRMLFGMALTLLFFHGLFHGEIAGMVIALAPFPCLLANRRWFDERWPNIG